MPHDTINAYTMVRGTKRSELHLLRAVCILYKSANLDYETAKEKPSIKIIPSSGGSCVMYSLPWRMFPLVAQPVGVPDVPMPDAGKNRQPRLSSPSPSNDPIWSRIVAFNIRHVSSCCCCCCYCSPPPSLPLMRHDSYTTHPARWCKIECYWMPKGAPPPSASA